MPDILKSRDFIAGLVYLALGAAAIYGGLDYGMGVASRMGPGYFPVAIGACLLAVGGVSIARALFANIDQIGSIVVRPFILITLSMGLFAYFLHRLGLIISLVVLLVVAALARQDAKLSPIGIIGAVGIIAFCAIVFVKGLGVPIPLVGYWLVQG